MQVQEVHVMFAKLRKTSCIKSACHYFFMQTY